MPDVLYAVLRWWVAAMYALYAVAVLRGTAPWPQRLVVAWAITLCLLVWLIISGALARWRRRRRAE